MKTGSLWIITALMTLALLGVFVMQLYYIKESYKLKSELFDQNVNSALNSVVYKVQKKNAFVRINKKGDEIEKRKERDLKSQMDAIIAFKLKFKENENLRKFKQQQEIVNYVLFQDSAIMSSFILPELISEERYKLYTNPSGKPKDINLDVVDTRDEKSNALLNRKVTPRVFSSKQDFQVNKWPDTFRYLVFTPQDM
ncbi:MAG: two-component sensor histidine kinase, partial [Bacteroidia bacterium]